MYLYNLTLQRASGITHAVHGNFSGTRTQELVVSRGRSLELLRPDPNTGKVRSCHLWKYLLAVYYNFVCLKYRKLLYDASMTSFLNIVCSLFFS